MAMGPTSSCDVTSVLWHSSVLQIYFKIIFFSIVMTGSQYTSLVSHLNEGP